MDMTILNQHPPLMRPLRMAEMIPKLQGLMMNETPRTWTGKKQQRKTVTTPKAKSVGKVPYFKPLTAAEMRIHLGIFSSSTKQNATTSVGSKWNASIKSATKSLNRPNNSSNLRMAKAKKALDFPPRVVSSNLNVTDKKFVTPRRPVNVNKPLQHSLAQNNVRISGICKFQESPDSKFKRPFTAANKENVPNSRKSVIPKIVKPQTNVAAPTLKKVTKETLKPLNFSSDKSSGSDASFLQKEKEIGRLDEEGNNRISSMSTPFKEYRQVREYFDDSCEMDSSGIGGDNTLTTFDKAPCKPNREESVIVSICELMNKANLTESKVKSKDTDLMLLKSELEAEILRLKMIKVEISNSIKAHETMLNSVNKQIQGKTDNVTVNVPIDINKTPDKVTEAVTPVPKSPTYKIPKINSCLRKTVLHKSAPNLNKLRFASPSPVKHDKALSQYMKIKQEYSFLTTPVITRNPSSTKNVLDTPAMTSRNLQKQLDMLYNGTP